MKIAIVSYDYPDEKRSVFPFVQELVEQWAKLGHECSVIAPNNFIKTKSLYCNIKKERSLTKSIVKIIRPAFFSVPFIKIGGNSISKILHKRAVNKGLRQLSIKPDIIYCHFWETAIEAYDFAKENKIPLFVATGESEIKSMLPQHIPNGFSDYVSGVICVSKKNKTESIELGLTQEQKCGIFPNAVNTKTFHLMDKMKIRKEMGISDDAFILAYVGWFNERKGIQRVSTALALCGTKPIYSFFIGNGEFNPEVPNILFKGKLMHHQISTYLNAADIFVLPTLREGCCNAVIEAMSCGLPIISSNLPFNWDVLNDTNSILVDPTDVNQIANAIIELRDNVTKRQELSQGAIKMAKNLSIDKRADNIIKFIKSLM